MQAASKATPASVGPEWIGHWLQQALAAEQEALVSRHRNMLADFSAQFLAEAAGEPQSPQERRSVVRGCTSLASAGLGSTGSTAASLGSNAISVQVPLDCGEAGVDHVGETERSDSVVQPTNSTSSKKRDSVSKSTALTSSPFPAASDQRLPDSTATEKFGWLERFVKSDKFDVFFSLLIVINSVIMAVEAQHKGMVNGAKLGYSDYMLPDSQSWHISPTEMWPGATRAFLVLDYIFGVAFTVEVALKLVCVRVKYTYEVFNWIDMAIVAVWLFQTSDSKNKNMAFDPMLLRLVRLVRLFRFFRLIRTIMFFDSLMLMTTAMRGSFSVLVWTGGLLVVTSTMVALFLQSMVEGYILNEENTMQSRMELYKYYGNFLRAMLTMFEITLGNWMPPCRALVENVSEMWLFFGVTHKLVVGFSVVSVITGVFIQETFKVAQSDDRIMMMQKARATRLHTKKMQALFDHADADGNSSLSKDEFRDVVDDPGVITWLASMDFALEDVEVMFTLLDNGDGELTAEELVQGVARLKGNARSIDLHMLKLDLDLFIDKQQGLLKDLSEKIDNACSSVRRSSGLAPMSLVPQLRLAGPRPENKLCTALPQKGWAHAQSPDLLIDDSCEHEHETPPKELYAALDPGPLLDGSLRSRREAS